MDIKSDMDLSGKLIIKVSLGDDIRRIPIHNEAITYDELVLMMQRVFRGKLTANDEITLKYKDEDGDLITIFDSSDLSFAIQCSRILKLHILLPASVTPESTAAISDSNVGKLKNQLRSIRDEVNKILDSLDGKGNQNESGHVKSEPSAESAPPNAALNKVNSSEFDPLQEKIQQNGSDEKKEAPMPSQHQQQQQQRPGSEPNSRPQSVSMPAPTPTMTSQPQATSANHNSHVGDYFNRTTAASSYPQMQYSSMPYQPQYSYPSGYVMDGGQVASSGGYSGPGQAVSQGQAAHPYPTQPPQQQQYGNAPGGAVYSAQAQPNPYSKGYTQPSPQHGYMPPRQ
ncbi:unnamed protein product [Brassicogethes aeneus]|uniref:PB1 domain-containing protein n=1 Tax=Brassicogethes aeneus TaxID=1431903 RepID=A0A9P0AT77_BRAAE|nr:unnamed protein product [Brassicogethes aeneus]